MSQTNIARNETKKSFYDGFIESHIFENLTEIKFHQKQLVEEILKVKGGIRMDVDVISIVGIAIKCSDDLYKFCLEVNEFISKILFERGNGKLVEYSKELFEITYHFAMLARVSRDARIVEMAINSSNAFANHKMN